MISNRKAPVAHPILDVIANRYSHLVYADSEVEKEKIESLLEAGRWAPSSYNDQPWRYVIGYKGDETYSKLADCLVEGNAYACKAPVLILSVASKKFAYNGEANRHAMHDVGCASGYMFLQATTMDLAMHEMAGFSPEKARDFFKITEDFEPCAMIAVGYPGNVEDLPTDLQERAKSERTRKTIEQMIWS